MQRTTKNGELLRRAAGAFDALVTMDRGLEFQHPLASQPFGEVLVRAEIAHLVFLVAEILDALRILQPGQLRRVGR